MRRALGTVVMLVVCAVILALPALAAAQGCAMCKTTLDGSNDPLVGALNTSVLFMMAMPYAIVGTIGSWIYFASRRGPAAESPPDGREPISETVKERVPVSQVATMDHALGVEPAESPLTPESWGKLGMWLFLAGDAMSFGALLAGYGALRYGSADWPVPATVLGIQLTAFMTFLLICSSVTMVKGLSAIQHGDQAGLRRFLFLTIVGGLMFLSMQAYEWTHLIHRGIHLTGNPFGATLFGTTFFCLTGFHGCHVFGGVVYLTSVLVQAMRGKYSATNNNPVEIAALYWHFVDLVWILVFTFVYLI